MDIRVFSLVQNINIDRYHIRLLFCSSVVVNCSFPVAVTLFTRCIYSFKCQTLYSIGVVGIQPDPKDDFFIQDVI